ncbi:unnamed protein product [Arabidopsis halleri]
MSFDPFHFPRASSANEASLSPKLSDLNRVTVQIPLMASGLMACSSNSGTNEATEAGGGASLKKYTDQSGAPSSEPLTMDPPDLVGESIPNMSTYASMSSICDNRIDNLILNNLSTKSCLLFGPTCPYSR